MDKKLVTATVYIRRKRIPRSTFFYRLSKGKIPYFQIGGKERKFFDLNDGVVWKKREKDRLRESKKKT